MLLLINAANAFHFWNTEEHLDKLKSYYDDVLDVIQKYPGAIRVIRNDLSCTADHKTYNNVCGNVRCAEKNYELYCEFRHELLFTEKNPMFELCKTRYPKKDNYSASMVLLKDLPDEDILIGGGFFNGLIKDQIKYIRSLSQVKLLDNLIFHYDGKTCGRLSESGISKTSIFEYVKKIMSVDEGLFDDLKGMDEDAIAEHLHQKGFRRFRGDANYIGVQYLKSKTNKKIAGTGATTYSFQDNPKQLYYFPDNMMKFNVRDWKSEYNKFFS